MLCGQANRDRRRVGQPLQQSRPQPRLVEVWQLIRRQSTGGDAVAIHPDHNVPAVHRHRPDVFGQLHEEALVTWIQHVLEIQTWVLGLEAKQLAHGPAGFARLCGPLELAIQDADRSAVCRGLCGWW